MPFEIESVHMGEVKVIKNRVFPDDRGFFMEVYRQDHFSELGITDKPFVQDNHSRSERGVIRGLHFQWQPPIAKLMRVTLGTALLVAVDIRKGSPTLGQHVMIEASDANYLQLWAPPSFARGFCVLSDVAEIQYKCTGIYNPNGEGGIRWDDPQIGIEWPVENPVLSAKDEQAPTLAQWLESEESNHFVYQEGLS
jgi:dTDP-4-dehydrorhamnose 3,5-epimerase